VSDFRGSMGATRLPYVALSRASFVNDSPWLQALKRPWFLVLWYAQWGKRLLAALRRWLPKAVRRLVNYLAGRRHVEARRARRAGFMTKHEPIERPQ
jgi:hypothetical protein